MHLLILDNRDSFVWNLAQTFATVGAKTTVVRSDADTVTQTLDEASATFDAVVVSPGPGRPTEAGKSLAAIRQLHGHMPILGVCLGHQAIGGSLRRHAAAFDTMPRQGLASDPPVVTPALGVAVSLPGVPIPLARPPARFATGGFARDGVDAGRRRDGGRAPGCSNLRPAVSSGIVSHRARRPHPLRLPKRHLLALGRSTRAD